jgi:hypothetical protein
VTGRPSVNVPARRPTSGLWTWPLSSQFSDFADFANKRWSPRTRVALETAVKRADRRSPRVASVSGRRTIALAELLGSYPHFNRCCYRCRGLSHQSRLGVCRGEVAREDLGYCIVGTPEVAAACPSFASGIPFNLKLGHRQAGRNLPSGSSSPRPRPTLSLATKTPSGCMTPRCAAFVQPQIVGLPAPSLVAHPEVAGRVPAGSREAQRGPLDSARKRAGRVLRVEPGSPGTSTANASQRPCARSQRWVGAEDRAVRLPERGRARPTRRPEIRVLPSAGPARSAARPLCQQRTSDRAARPSESRAGRRGQRRSAPRGRPRSDSRRTAGRNAAAAAE